MPTLINTYSIARGTQFVTEISLNLGEIIILKNEGISIDTPSIWCILKYQTDDFPVDGERATFHQRVLYDRQELFSPREDWIPTGRVALYVPVNYAFPRAFIKVYSV